MINSCLNVCLAWSNEHPYILLGCVRHIVYDGFLVVTSVAWCSSTQHNPTVLSSHKLWSEHGEAASRNAAASAYAKPLHSLQIKTLHLSSAWAVVRTQLTTLVRDWAGHAHQARITTIQLYVQVQC
ncbi:hypothetical protein ABBQ32_003030 [Trebouxia sp. C0010 RCD-2024]